MLHHKTLNTKAILNQKHMIKYLSLKKLNRTKDSESTSMAMESTNKVLRINLRNKRELRNTITM